MASSLFGISKLNNDIKFINTHTGGKTNDTDDELKKQLHLIETLNRENKHTIDTSDTNNRNYRINNSSTVIGEQNISNPIIVPPAYELYYDNYLFHKNLNSINNRVIQTTNYINIDSQIVNNQINSTYFVLENDPLTILNDENLLRIRVQSSILHNFQIGNKITLQGITPIKFNTTITFTFTNNSNIVQTDLPISYNYDPKFNNNLIQFSDILYVFPYFYNIPTDALNNTFNCIIANNTTSFVLPITFYSSSATETLTTKCNITLNSIGNIQIAQLNAFYPLGKYNILSYHTISDIVGDTIIVKISDIACFNIPFVKFGGKKIQIGNITETFINSEYEYLYEFNKKYFNIASIKIISSEISIYSSDNKNITISTKNNKLYWKYFDDTATIYDITIPSGAYSYDELETTIANAINNLNPTIECVLQFQPSLLKFGFSFYQKKNLPQCLTGLTISSDVYTITIYDEKHALRVGDKITITNAIDYYTLDKSYINNTHTITEIQENSYEIEISFVNPIADAGDTKGGYSTIITLPYIAQLLFDYENTVGGELYFSNVGSDYAITKFSNYLNNYQITNQQPYLYNISSFPTFENLNLSTSYVLLKIEGLNVCYNPFNQNYFYKFQTQKTILNDVLYNTFVDAPIYFNPPLEELQKLKMSFISPTGTPMNFKIFNYAMTMEIVTITNASENTHINTQIGRI